MGVSTILPLSGCSTDRGFGASFSYRLRRGLARVRGSEKTRDDHLGLLSVAGVALAECGSQQFLLG
jgi:hypothetical protein